MGKDGFKHVYKNNEDSDDEDTDQYYIKTEESDLVSSDGIPHVKIAPDFPSFGINENHCQTGPTCEDPAKYEVSKMIKSKRFALLSK